MIDILSRAFAENSLTVSALQIQQMAQFWAMVKKTNEVINLTALTNDEDAAEKHFADSLLGASLFKKGASVIDLGSGAGFPGIPLAIVRPDLQITLMDSLNKRVGFLNEAILALKLDNVTAVHSRAEDAARGKFRAVADVVTVRAVAALPTLIEYALPLLKKGGRCYAYKGQDWEAETVNAQKALKAIGGKILQNHQFILNNKYFRVIIEIEKLFETSDKYPRGQDKPKRNPIG